MGDKLGYMVLRDFAIAKIKNLHVCNSSLVKPKERADSEVFYLKWIAKQLALAKKDDNDDNDEKENDDDDDNAEMQRIEAMYPRYIELVKKHGNMNLNKKVAEKMLSVTVILKSMDPESITAKPV